MPGTLTITPKALNVTVDNKTKTYGQDDPEFTWTAVGLVEGDALSGTLTREAGKDVRESGYAIRMSDLTVMRGEQDATSNYEWEITDGRLTITPKALAVTAESKTKTYGENDPALTYTVEGLAGTDAASDVLTGVLTRAAGENVVEGGYDIKIGTLKSISGNYTFAEDDFTAAKLTIAPKALTVTADNKAKVYGEADPELTYTVEGLIDGDTAANVLTGKLARAEGDGAGEYAITQGALAANANYNITFVSGTLTIADKALTVTAVSKTKTYGEADPQLTYTVEGLPEGTDLSTVFEGVLTRAAGNGVGEYAITQGTLATKGSYTMSFVPGKLTITPRTLTVKAEDKTKTYGEADPALTWTVVEGFAYDDTADVVTGALTRAAVENVGTYAIRQSAENPLSAGKNYTITFVPGTLTITPKALTVTADAQQKAYGDADPALTYTVVGLVNGDAKEQVLAGALVREAGEDVREGGYAINKGSLTVISDNYTLDENGFTAAKLTIIPKALTVTAENKTKVYGDNDPDAWTYTVTDANGNAVTGVVTGDPARAAGVNVGEYAITQGTLTASDNYTMNFVPGTLTITPKALTVTAESKTKTYGEADPDLTWTAEGLVTGDALTVELERTAGNNVGEYAIKAKSIDAGENYTVRYVGKSLTIQPKALTVKPDAQTKTYGEADPELTYTVEGLIDGDTAGNALTGTLSRAVGDGAGEYAITKGTLKPISSNYTLTENGIAAAKLTITPKALTVKAENKTKVYGDPDPELTWTITGLIEGDEAADVMSGALAREAGENVHEGGYEITKGTLNAGANYTIQSFTGATLTINRRALTVTADAKAKVSGTADPELTYTVTGLASGDTANTVLTGSLARAAGDDAGKYAITQGTLAPKTGNYTIATFTPAELTISQNILTVTAEAKEKTYGEAEPALTWTVTGLANGDDKADVLTGALVREAGDNVGFYAIKQGNLAIAEGYTGKYALNFNGANLTITPKTLNVTADNQTKVYGSADPRKLTYTVDGLIDGDEAGNVLSGKLARDFDSDDCDDVGDHSILQGTLKANANYTLNYVPGNLTIQPKALTIRPDAQTKTYGNADPELTYTVEGLAFDDEAEAMVTGTPSREKAGEPEGENVGTYAIKADGLTINPNYTIGTFVPASLTITPRALTVTAGAAQKVYGTADEALDYTVNGLIDGDTEEQVFTGALSREAGNNVGEYAITRGTLTTNGNYTIEAFTGATLTITPRPLVVTVDEGQSKVYGEADPELTYDIVGLADDDSEDQVFTGALSRAAGEDVREGGYEITQGTLTVINSNYMLAESEFTGATLTISPRPLTVVAKAQEKTYGETTFGENDTDQYDYDCIGTTAAGDTLVVKLKRNDGKDAGRYSIVRDSITVKNAAGKDVSGNYTLLYTGAKLTIKPKTLTIRLADDAVTAKVYGEDDSELAYTVEGLVDGDAVSGALTRAPGEDVGEYPIMTDGLTVKNRDDESVLNNYNLVLDPEGTQAMTITPRPLVITVDEGLSKEYGKADPELTFTVTAPKATDGSELPGGLYAGDSKAEVFTGELKRANPDRNDVGVEYAVTQGTLKVNDNYTIASFVGNVMTIAPKALTVTVDDQTKTYGDADPEFTYTASGLIEGDTLSVTLAREEGKDVREGGYAISQTGLSIKHGDQNVTDNYAWTVTPGTLTINKRPVKVTADAQTRNFDEVIKLTYTCDNLVDGDSLEGELACNHNNIMGTYPITQGTLKGGTNYEILSFTGADLTIVNKPVLTVTADAQTKVYGEDNPTLTYTVTDANGNTVTDAVTGKLILETGEDVGVYAITQGTLQAINANAYDLNYVGAKLTITPKPVTVTPENKTKVYGAADPDLTYTVTDANGDAVTGAVTGELSRAEGVDVGEYAITQGMLKANGNYTMSFVPGAKLTITPKTLTVTAVNKTKTYGEADPELTWTVEGLANGDTEENVLTGALTREQGENVREGGYAITQGMLAANANYNMAFTEGKLTINKAVLTVIPDVGVRRKAYGEADPALTYTVKDSKGVDVTSADLVTGTLKRGSGEEVGDYDFDISGLTVDANYTATIASGAKFTITKAKLIIAAVATSKEYGVPDSSADVFKYVTVGLSAADEVNIGQILNVSLTRAKGENVGVYAIKKDSIELLTQAAKDHYDVIFKGSRLTIKKRKLTVTPQAMGKTYGSDDPEKLEYDVANLPAGVTKEDVLEGALEREPGATPGEYAIRQGDLALRANVAANYELAFVDGVKFTIAKKAITVTAENKKKTYGDADPALTYTVEGLVNGEKAEDVLTGALVLEGTTINKGALAISSAYQNRYEWAETGAFTAGTLTVNKKALTVTADAKAKVHGQPDPVLDYTVTGLVNGDTKEQVFTGQLTRVQAGTEEGENVGSYDIKQDDQDPLKIADEFADKYTLNYVGAKLTIGLSIVTITADPQTKVYGEVDPVLTYTCDPRPSDIEFTGALSRVEGENAGEYTIGLGGLSAGKNYTLNFVSNKLTIQPKPLTVKPESKTKTYGDADPALTYTVTDSNGDAVTDAVTGKLSREAGEDAGVYAIKADGLVIDPNYTLATFVPANLTIQPKALTIKPDNQVKTYGDAEDPGEWNYTVTDTDGNVVTGAVTGALSREPGQDAGEYDITMGTLTASANYALRLDSAKMTINKRPVTIEVDPTTCSKIYGETAEHIAFRLTDIDQLAAWDQDSPTVTGTLSRVPGTKVGKYAIKTDALRIGDADNYDFKVKDDVKFTITRRPVELTWSKTELVYDKGYALKPTATVKDGELLGNDSCSVVVDAVDSEDNVISATNAGKYTAVAVSLSNPNYRLSDDEEDNRTTFTITKAEIDKVPAPRDVTVGSAGVVNGKLDLSEFLKDAVSWRVTMTGGIVTNAAFDKDESGKSTAILNYNVKETINLSDETDGSVTIRVASTNYEDYRFDVKFYTSDAFTLHFDCGGAPQEASREIKGDVAILTSSLLPGQEFEDSWPGHEFKGWYLDAAKTVLVPENTLMGGADRTVYAKWTPVQYRINLDPGEYGTLPEGYESGVILYDVTTDPAKLMLPTLPNQTINGTVNVTFRGWRLKVEGKELEPSLETAVEPIPENDGATYEAVWKLGELEGKITFEAADNNDSGLLGVGKLDAGTTEASSDTADAATSDASTNSLINTMKTIADKQSDSIEDSSDSKTTVEMKVSGAVSESDANEAKQAIDEIRGEQDAGETLSDLSFIDITITSTTTTTIENGEDDEETVTLSEKTIPDTGRVVEIPLKYDLTGRYNPTFYRYHKEGNNATQKLTRLNKRPKANDMVDGTYFISGKGATATVYVYSKFFSLFGEEHDTDQNNEVCYLNMDYNDGTGRTETQTLNFGASIAGFNTRLTTFKSGEFTYRFSQWVDDRGNPVNFDSPLEDDLNMKAEWNKLTEQQINVQNFSADYDETKTHTLDEINVITDAAGIDIYFGEEEELNEDNYKEKSIDIFGATTPCKKTLFWYATSETCVPNPDHGTVLFEIKGKPNTVTNKPKALSQTYNGGTVQLVSAGAVAAGTGTVMYALGTNATTPPDEREWHTTIPTASSAGTYYVWYKVKGDGVYADVAPDCMIVKIDPPAAKVQESAPSAPAGTPQSASKPTPTIPVFKKRVKTTISAAPGEIYQIDLGGGTGKKYKSSKKKVAIVDQNGLITVRAAGKTKITVKVGKKTRTLNLTVKDPTIPTMVTVNASGPLTGKKGDTVQLTAVLPAGTESAIKWQSSNKKVATVSSTGLVTFKKPGSATITATAVRGKKKGKVKVKVTK